MINYVVVTIEYLFKKVFVFNIIAFGAFARVYTSYYLYLPLFVKYILCDLLMFRGKNKKSGWPQLGFKNQKNYLRSVDRP